MLPVEAIIMAAMTISKNKKIPAMMLVMNEAIPSLECFCVSIVGFQQALSNQTPRASAAALPM
jgi:hypothetical protein